MGDFYDASPADLRVPPTPRPSDAAELERFKFVYQENLDRLNAIRAEMIATADENARLREALDRLVRQAVLTDDYDEWPHSTLRSAVLQARRALTPTEPTNG